ncbi:MAG: hypothetical protein U0798_14965 [Gemmataceae bacterium]
MTFMVLFDLQLPNAASWMYFSFILAVAVFFQFSRPFAARNRDILGLYLFAPGFLHLQRAHALSTDLSAETIDLIDSERNLAYTWLLSACLLWFLRCILDFVFTRRPTMIPNLTVMGIIWLGSALLLGHLGSAIIRPVDPWEPVGRRPAAVVGVESGAAAIGSVATGKPVTDLTKASVSASLGAVGHIAIIVGLWMIGAIHFQSLPTGVAMAFAYVLVPYTGFRFGAFHLALPAALIVWSFFSYRKVAVSGGLLGLAAGMAFFPTLLLPAWLQFYRGRGSSRFAFWFAGGLIAGALLTILGLWAIGSSPADAWRAANPGDWIPWKRPESESIWTGIHWAYRLPVFVVFAAFVGMTLVWPNHRDLGQLVATSAAVLISIQFWYADQGGVYVLWFLPLLLIMSFRPSTVELQPPADPGPSWLTRFQRKPARPL